MAEIYSTPLRLIPNQIRRNTSPAGGREVRRMRGESITDEFGGECTIGCAVKFSYVDTAPDRKSGQSRVILPEGRAVYLQDAIDLAPEKMLGKAHYAAYGNNMQLLLKYLDFDGQLALQAHPDDARAQEAFGEANGKTESWYVIDIRDDASEEPYILAGFKEDVTPEKFEALYEAGDVAAMEACCHKIHVKPDEMYIIRGGLVHALGVGCFVAEIQQPSDLIVKVDKNPDYPDGEEAWKRLQMDTYHYDADTYEENLNKILVPRTVVQEKDGNREEILLGKAQTPCFAGMRYVVATEIEPYANDVYSICTVIGGSGKAVFRGGELAMNKGDELFVPASVEALKFVSDNADDPMIVVRALPPQTV